MTPQAIYRNRFKGLVLDQAPSSVLDVGCGYGGLIRSLNDAGIAASGVDPEAGGAGPGGLKIVKAVAESLPFDDDAFDIVVSEFSLHHFADFATSVAECVRVARRYVMFLDCWYDRSIPSQKCAEAFDLWMKGIDQAAGEIHNPVLTAGEILAVAGEVPAEIDHWLVLEPMAEEKFQRLVNTSLAKAQEKQAAEVNFEPVLQMVKSNGISEDGAIFTKLAVGR